MRAYLDLWTGLSGDMMVGSLLDSGWTETAMRAVLAQIPIDGVDVKIETRRHHGITGLGIVVSAAHELPERSYRDIRDLLAGSALSDSTRARSLSLFRRLAEVEGEIHGKDPEDVHFHELGAIDSIVDIVLAVAGLEALGIELLACGPVPLSRGEVTTAHGVLPVPTPATLKLLEGHPVRWLPFEGEWLTPTGALILACLVDSWGPPPDLRLLRVGTGAGTRKTPDRANIVRLLLGEPDGTTSRDDESLGWISVIETHMDDLDPRQGADVAERILTAGALDVFRSPILMKKGRIGVLFTVLCRPDREEALGAFLLQETSTLGIRVRREFRRELRRWVETVETPYGTVRVKWSRPGGRPRAMPEFEDLSRCAAESGVPIWEVVGSVQAIIRSAGRGSASE